MFCAVYGASEYLDIRHLSVGSDIEPHKHLSLGVVLDCDLWILEVLGNINVNVIWISFVCRNVLVAGGRLFCCCADAVGSGLHFVFFQPPLSSPLS